MRKLDKAAAKHIVHPNQAARRKSQLGPVLNEKLATASATQSAAP